MTAIAFPLLLGLATAGQQSGGGVRLRRTTSRPAQDTQMRIIGLRNTTAEELTATIAGVIHDVDIAIDPRTNTLILLGHSEAVARVESLVEALDVVDSRQKIVNAVMGVRHVTARVAKQKLEEMLSAESDLRVSITADGRANQLRVNGPADQVKRAHNLIADIDRAPKIDTSFFIQIYCLIEGDDEAAGDSDLGFPDGEEVADELSGLGIRNTSLVFKTLARVEGQSEFRITGSASRDQRVEVNGEVMESTGETVKMSLQMSLAQPDGDEACNILTTVRVPFGDQVIIGAAPHEGATVVLVVRIVKR